jgi:hypothetical protein
MAHRYQWIEHLENILKEESSRAILMAHIKKNCSHASQNLDSGLHTAKNSSLQDDENKQAVVKCECY